MEDGEHAHTWISHVTRKCKCKAKSPACSQDCRSVSRTTQESANGQGHARAVSQAGTAMFTPEGLFPQGFEDSRCPVRNQNIKCKVIRSVISSKNCVLFHCLRPLIQLLANIDQNWPTFDCPAGLVATPGLLLRFFEFQGTPSQTLVNLIPIGVFENPTGSPQGNIFPPRISHNDPKVVGHLSFEIKITLCVRGNMTETPGGRAQKHTKTSKSPETRAEENWCPHSVS